MSHSTASNITLTNSGLSSSPKAQPAPVNADTLRTWRIGLIRHAWRRVVARESGVIDTRTT